MTTLLHGVNFSGMNFTPGQQWPVPMAVPYYITQKGMNVVRLNILWELLQPTLGGPLDPAMVSGISDQVRRITGAGASVIIEMHNYGRRTVSGVQYIIGESANVNSWYFGDLWSKLAVQFGSNPKVIFGLMNEPHDQNTQTLVAVSNEAIAAIRATGASQLILVSGNGWNSYGWAAGQDNLTEMLSITDSGNNFAFDVHHYFDASSAGQSATVVPSWDAGLANFTAWARANKKRGFCGEFAAANTPSGIAAVKQYLDYLTVNNDVWLGWTWWGGGGWWPHDYLFLLDPYGSKWDAGNPDAAAAVTWANPTDKPMMCVLQPYIQGTSAKAP